MVHKCVVLGCKSEWSPGCGLSFHSFPTDIIKRNQWLSIVPLKNAYYPSAKICSLHFKKTDYEPNGKKLKSNVCTPFYKSKNVFAEYNLPSEETQSLIDEETDTSQESTELQKFAEYNLSSEETQSLKDEETDTSEESTELQKDFENTFPEEKITPMKILEEEPVRNVLRQSAENFPLKRSLLLELLEANTSRGNLEQQEEAQVIKDFGNRIFAETLTQLTPMKIEDEKGGKVMKQFAHKGVQARISTPQEVALRRKNKILNQKISRLTKRSKKLKQKLCEDRDSIIVVINDNNDK